MQEFQLGSSNGELKISVAKLDRNAIETIEAWCIQARQFLGLGDQVAIRHGSGPISPQPAYSPQPAARDSKKPSKGGGVGNGNWTRSRKKSFSAKKIVNMLLAGKIPYVFQSELSQSNKGPWGHPILSRGSSLVRLLVTLLDYDDPLSSSDISQLVHINPTLASKTLVDHGDCFSEEYPGGYTLTEYGRKLAIKCREYLGDRK